LSPCGGNSLQVSGQGLVEDVEPLVSLVSGEVDAEDDEQCWDGERRALEEEPQYGQRRPQHFEQQFHIHRSPLRQRPTPTLSD